MESFEELMADAKMHDPKIWVYVKKVTFEEAVEILDWLKAHSPRLWYTNMMSTLLNQYTEVSVPYIEEFELKVFFFNRELALQFGMLFPFWLHRSISPSTEGTVIDILSKVTDTSLIER